MKETRNTARRMVLWGLVSAVLYSLFFIVLLGNSILRPDSDAQIAAAIISSPTSAWIHMAIRPLLDMFGAPGARYEVVAEWTVFYIGGTLQVFSIAALLGMLFRTEGTSNRGVS
jgi:hypothetical protein